MAINKYIILYIRTVIITTGSLISSLPGAKPFINQSNIANAMSNNFECCGPNGPNHFVFRPNSISALIYRIDNRVLSRVGEVAKHHNKYYSPIIYWREHDEFLRHYPASPTYLHKWKATKFLMLKKYWNAVLICNLKLNAKVYYKVEALQTK